MKKAKALTAVLLVTLITSSAIGCEKRITQSKNEKISISVGVLDTSESTEAIKKAFMEQYPDIEVECIKWSYNVNMFQQEAEKGTLPTVFDSWFSEVNKTIDSGYSADLTDALIDYGYVDEMNPELLELVTNEDGRIYGVPVSAYAQGLCINKNLFIQSGLVNEDGSIKIPDTYEQLAEFAAIIKEKTNVAGFVIPSSDNLGGWHLMNIAWSNGVEFVERLTDGTWKASFDTPEFVATLEWLYDLKWNKNALLDSEYDKEFENMIHNDQVAMIFAPPPHGKASDHVAFARVPKGTVDRVSQMGGNLYMVNSKATPEQIDAAFKWLEFNGVSPTYTDSQIKLEEEQYKDAYESDKVVLPQDAFDIWVTPKRIEQNKKIREKYVNINPKDYETYFGFEGVTIRPEVPVACQELYGILDSVIQKIYTESNIDIPKIVSEAAQEWQVKYLDEINAKHLKS